MIRDARDVRYEGGPLGGMTARLDVAFCPPCVVVWAQDHGRGTYRRGTSPSDPDVLVYKWRADVIVDTVRGARSGDRMVP